VGVHSVVEIERIGDRVRHHDGCREMDDGLDLVLGDDAVDQRLIPVSPTTSGTPSATAQPKPVDRISSSTTRSSAAARARTIWLTIYSAPPAL
jgi:hypothetical protein